MKRIVLCALTLAFAELAHSEAILRVQFLGSTEQVVAGDAAVIRTSGPNGTLDVFGAGDFGPTSDTIMVDGFDNSVDGSGLWTWRLHLTGGGIEIMDGLCASSIDETPSIITVSLRCVSTMPTEGR